MGRLKSKKKRQLLRIIQGWILPIVVAVLCVFAVHTTLASPEPTAQELQEYLQDNTLTVGVEIVDGYQQVFYTYKGNRIYMEGAEQSNLTDPVVSGQYIAWVKATDGGSQIFLYDAIAKTTQQITSDSTNSNPSLNANRIVWERWVNGTWQIYYYDGFGTSQISDGNGVAIRSSIQGTEAAFAQYIGGGTWQVIRSDLNSGQNTVVKEGDETEAWPKFKGEEITTTLPEAL